MFQSILIWLVCCASALSVFSFRFCPHFVRVVFHFIFIFIFFVCVCLLLSSLVHHLYFFHTFCALVHFYTVLLCVAAVDCLPRCCSLFFFSSFHSFGGFEKRTNNKNSELYSMSAIGSNMHAANELLVSSDGDLNEKKSL